MSHPGGIAMRSIGMLLLCVVLAASEAPSAAAVDRAIGSGLAFLRAQQRDDGAIDGRTPVALSGLATLAYLAAGTTPEAGADGTPVRRMLGYLLSQQDANGWLGGDGGRMYSHGIACLAFTAAIGAGGDDALDERLREALGRALRLTITAARVAKPEPFAGGWRYQPDEASADVSLSGWQLMSLRSAARIGMAVPEDVIAGAEGFVRRLVDDEGRVGYDHKGEDRPALRGIALHALARGDGPPDPLIARILARMRAEPPVWQGPWFFYRACQDAFGLPLADPQLWTTYRAQLATVLVAHQSADGSWPAPPGDNEREHGPAYATAMAVLALAADRRLLP